jgi:hypothetical protein
MSIPKLGLEPLKSKPSYINKKDDPDSFYLTYSGIIESGDVI